MSPAASEAPASPASRIVKLIAAYRAARALTAATALGLFDALARGPATAEGVAEAAGTDARATEVLLDALAALGFVAKEGPRYSNEPSLAPLLTGGTPGSLAGNLRWQELLAPAWAELPRVVREGRPVRGLDALLDADPAFAEEYMRAMADISGRPARDLAAGLGLGDERDLLDVGGGPAAFSLAMLERAPRLRAVVLDLPPSIRTAEKLAAASPHRARLAFRPGDYHEADFGREAFDLVLLSHVTHNEGEAENRALLAKAHAALRPGGRVVVHDFMVGPDRAGPPFAALFSVHMLVYTSKGRTYAAEEYEAWLAGAGFSAPRRFDVALGAENASIAIVARKT